MLLFQEFRLSALGVRLTMVIAGALFALLAAMGLVALVKMYSVAYLGQPRSPAAARATEAPWPTRIGLALLSLMLVALSVLPLVVVPWLERPVAALLGVQLAGRVAPANLQLNPAYSDFAAASSSAMAIFLPLVAGSVALLAGLRYLARRGGRRAVPVWVAASGDAEPQVQYSASAYTNPMRVFFSAFYRPGVTLERGEIRLTVRDWFADELYPRLSRAFGAATRVAARLQAGRVTVYTSYILLVFVLVLLIDRALQ